MSVVIKTVNLTKRYGTLVALSNLNLEISAGDCFGFIGPNGAGKSTTIKILATLLQPTWGEARVCDYVVGYQSRQIRPLIGYVPDYFGAYEDMVVQEYLEFFAAAYNINGAARVKLVNDVLELTDLAYKRDALVDGLSRGMKQRLSIARVLLHDHVFVGAEVVGDVPDEGADLARLVADDVIADAGLAPRGLEERGEDLNGGALAGAVGADEAEAVALVDLEVEVGQRDERAVALGQVDCFDHGRHV